MQVAAGRGRPTPAARDYAESFDGSGVSLSGLSGTRCPGQRGMVVPHGGDDRGEHPVGGGEIGGGQVGERRAGAAAQWVEELTGHRHAVVGVVQQHPPTVAGIGFSADMPRGDHAFDQVGDRGRGQAHEFAQLSGGERAALGFGGGDVHERAEIGTAQGVRMGEQMPDLLGHRGQRADIGGDLAFGVFPGRTVRLRRGFVSHLGRPFPDPARKSVGAGGVGLADYFSF